MSIKMKLTQAEVNRIPFSEKQLIYQDAEYKNLFLRVGKGRKSFYFQKKVNGKLLKVGIGECGLSVARERAMALYVEKSHFVLSMKKKQTLGSLYDYYIGIKGESKGVRSIVGHLVLFWDRCVSSITKEDMSLLYSRIVAEGKVATANAVIAYVSAMINLAIKDDLYEGRNPTVGLKKRRVDARSRYMGDDELSRFFAALGEVEKDVLSRDSCDAIRILLYTGQRKLNVLSMRWDELDLDHEVWTIPSVKFKGRRVQRVVLPGVVLEILRRRRSVLGLGEEYVFPSGGRGLKSPHLRDVRRTYGRLLLRAGIEGLRIHDLRRTLGSWLINDGVPLEVISKMLGHSDTRVTERVYAHLGLEPRRKAAERFSKAFDGVTED